MATTEAGIYALQAPYLDRYVQVGIAAGQVISVTFPREADEEAQDDHALLDRIEAYLEGSRDDFDDVEVALTVPTERRGILEKLRTVGYGENCTVAKLARMAPGLDDGKEEDRQLVRTTLDENPIPLIIPDHRVRDGPSAAPPDVEQRLRSLEGL